MDIWLIKSEEWTEIRPTSIHGMLWLQTHFENDHWEAISSNQVKISNLEAQELSSDAQDAGLSLNCLPSVLNSKRFSKIKILFMKA